VLHDNAPGPDAAPTERITGTAITALQEASEAFGIARLEQANSYAIHGGRVTIMPKDMNLAKLFSASTSK
jgi:histone H3/H4